MSPLAIIVLLVAVAIIGGMLQLVLYIVFSPDRTRRARKLSRRELREVMRFERGPSGV